jgi:hypothetical protein
MNDKLKITRKEVVVAYFNSISQHFATGGTELNHEKSQDGLLSNRISNPDSHDRDVRFILHTYN